MSALAALFAREWKLAIRVGGGALMGGDLLVPLQEGGGERIESAVRGHGGGVAAADRLQEARDVATRTERVEQRLHVRERDAAVDPAGEVAPQEFGLVGRGAAVAGARRALVEQEQIGRAHV